MVYKPSPLLASKFLYWSLGMGFYRSAKFFYALFLILVVFLNISYAEDIILTGNQVLRIENTTYSTKGHIFLYDNSSLVIRNSVFNFIQDYHEQYQIWLRGNASLVIENGSTLTSTQRFQVFLFDTSKASVSNSVAININLDWPRGAVFVPNDNSAFECNNSQIDRVGDQYSYSVSTKATILIQNSSVESLSLIFPLSSSAIINDIRKGWIANFELSKQYMNLPYDILVYNSSINSDLSIWAYDSSQLILNRCNLNSVRVDGNAKVTANDSILDQMVVSFNQYLYNIELRGLRSGFTQEYTLDLLSSNSFYLRLENTNIGGWTVKIVNCQGSTFIITDCKLSLIRPMNGSFTVKVEGSEIDDLWLWDFTGTLFFANSVIGNWSDTRNYPPAENKPLITGSVVFRKADIINQALGDQWLNTIIRRKYPCYVSANYPESTFVKVYDPNGKLVYTGRPIRNGQLTTDEIKFDYSNYNKTFKMQLVYQSQVLDQFELKIATSTPIKLSTSILLPPPPKSRSMPWLPLLLDD